MEYRHPYQYVHPTNVPQVLLKELIGQIRRRDLRHRKKPILRFRRHRFRHYVHRAM
jgi:hypothetical protein